MHETTNNCKHYTTTNNNNNNVPTTFAGFLGITATAGAKAFSHSLSLALTLTILTNLTQYMAWKAKARAGGHWRRYGPTYLMAAAVPLATADLFRHALQDGGLWDGPSSHMYRPDCGPVSGLHGFLCLSLTGWLFTIVFTYSGFGCMLAGVAWGTNLPRALRHALRGGR